MKVLKNAMLGALAALSIWAPGSANAAALTATFNTQPSGPNSLFSIDLVLNPAQNIASYQFDIAWDPAIMTLTSATDPNGGNITPTLDTYNGVTTTNWPASHPDFGAKPGFESTYSNLTANQQLGGDVAQVVPNVTQLVRLNFTTAAGYQPSNKIHLAFRDMRGEGEAVTTDLLGTILTPITFGDQALPVSVSAFEIE